MDSVHRAFQTYLKWKADLVKNSLGHYAVIHEDSILDVFPTHEEAVALVRRTKLWGAIIKRVVEDESIAQVLYRGTVVETDSDDLSALPDDSGDPEASCDCPRGSCKAGTDEIRKAVCPR